METSRHAAMRALELDNKLAEAWLALAEIQFKYDWDWSNAEVTMRKALKYGPNNAPVLRLATWVALTLGDNPRQDGVAELLEKIAGRAGGQSMTRATTWQSNDHNKR